MISWRSGLAQIRRKLPKAVSSSSESATLIPLLSCCHHQQYRVARRWNTTATGIVDETNQASEIHEIKENSVADDTSADIDVNVIKDATIYKEPYPDTVHPDLEKHLRCCVTDHGEDNPPKYTHDTGLSICFLGTGAGKPSKQRSTTSTLLRMAGRSYLFDVGEGTQRQLIFSTVKLSLVDQIFITHMHGDHVFGLLGFLLGLQNGIANRESPTIHTIKIYGPLGLYNFITANLTLSCSNLRYLQIEVHELVGAREERRYKNRQKDPFLARYDEFGHRNIRRRYIESKNGVWTIAGLSPPSRSDLLDRSKRRELQNKPRVQIRAAEVMHVSGVPTFGFVVDEEEPPRNIDPVKAASLGVSPAGKKYELLRYGFSVFTDDGSTEIMPEQVLRPRVKKGRKIAILGDNRGWTYPMKQLVKDSDVLIHEATLAEKDIGLTYRGHSTASMAGKFATDTDVGVLILNHLSPRMESEDKIGALRQAAEEASGDSIRVVLANDFMEFLVPREGFSKELLDEVEDSDKDELELPTGSKQQTPAEFVASMTS